MTASKKVLRQVEYYFGNVNMMRDTFMKEEIKKDEGWISLETMMNVSLNFDKKNTFLLRRTEGAKLLK